MSRKSGHRCRQIVAPCFFILVAASLCRGQEAPSTPIEFQRIFIPSEDRLEAIDVKAVPFERAEFNSLIAELNAKHRSQLEADNTRIVQARYAARLEGRQLVSGRAELTIEHALPTGVAAAVTLAPWGLAIERLQWLDDSAAQVQAGIDSTGQFLVSIDRSRVLTLGWSLREANDALQYPVFQLALPPCPSHVLELEVPADLRPVCEVGLVTRLPPSSEESWVPWQIDLAGAQQATLSFVSAHTSPIRRRVVLATQDNVLRLTSAGLDMEHRFQLDVHHAAVERLVLELDPGVSVASAKLGNDPVRVQMQRATNNQPDLAVLELSRPVQGTGQQLTVTTFAPLTLNELWKLPTVRLQEATWRRGTMTLDVTDSLVLRNLVWTDAALRHLESLAMPLSGESRRFELLSPKAALTVQISPPPSQLLATSGTTVTINESTMTAQFSAHLSSPGGDIFDLQLRHEPGWIIDSFETIPSNLIEESSLRGKRGTTRDLRLREAIRPDAPLRMIIKAHRSTPADAVLTGRDLRPVALLGSEQHRALVAVLPKAPLQLAITGDASLERLSALRLVGVERQLVEAPEGCLLYVDSPRSESLRVGLRSEPPRYQAQATIDANVESGVIEVAYVVRCEPAASRISTIRVRFSQPVEEALTWSLTDERPGTIASRRLDESGLEWELTLRRPRSVPFEFHARRTIPLAAATPLPLLSCPDATMQAGLLRLSTSDGSAFGYEQQGLRAIPLISPGDRSSRELRGVFRYAPAQVASLSIVPHAEHPPGDHVWIWSAELTSYLNVGGETNHVALFRIENNGARQLSVSLPVGVTVNQLDLSGVPVTWPAGATTLQISLPATQRFPTMRLAYRESSAPLRVIGSIQPPLPTLNVHCLRWRWNVWLPPGFRVLSQDDTAVSGSHSEPSWDKRLFGYSLLRRTSEPWNLFSRSSWRESWTSWTALPRADRKAGLFLESLVEDLATVDPASNRAVTWGDVLRGYLASPSTEHLTGLWIDTAALRDGGIFPETPVSATRERLSAVECLRRANLMLLVVDEQLVITTTAGPARGLYGNCDTVSDGVLIARDTDLAAKQRDRRCVSATEWSRTSSPIGSSWLQGTDELPHMPLAGWSNVQRELLPPVAPTLHIYSTSFARGLSWAAYFLAAAVGMWRGRSATHGLTLFFVVAMASILFVPTEMVGLARAVVGGLVTAGGLLFLSRMGVGAKKPTDESLVITVGHAPAPITVAILSLMAAGWMELGVGPVAWGQESATPAASTNQRTLYRVFDPSTASGEAPSKYVYVSRDFFDRLTELKAQLDEPRTPWLLSSANYTVGLESPESDPTLRLAELVAEFELSVLTGTDQAIELPFRRDEVRVLEATLDGKPLYSQFSEDGSRLVMEISTGVRQHLRLSLRPVSASRDGLSGIDIGIPSVNTAQVRVATLRRNNVQVLNAVGGITHDAVNGTLVVALGQAKRLQVRWPAQNTVADETPEHNVAQSLWLRADSGGYVLDARFNISISRGDLRELELYADAGLRPLPLIPNQPVSWIEAVDSPPDAPQRLRVRLDRSYGAGEMLAFQLSFAAPEPLKSTPWPGPWIYPANGMVGRLSLGLSWPTSFTAKLEHDLGWVETSVRDFATLWGVSEQPVQAFELPRGRSDWTLALSSRESQLTVREECALVVGRDVAQFTFDAQVEIGESPVLQLQVALPAGARVKNISALQEDADLVRRWSQDDSQTATLFLQHPVQGDLRLQLDGELAVPRRGQVTFAPLSLVGAQTMSRRLRVDREPEVLVTLPGPPPSASPETSFSTALAKSRPVVMLDQSADLTVAPGLAALDPIVLSIAPNPARFSGQLVSRVKYETSQWWIEADVVVKVQQGVLDTLRLRMPIEVAQSLEITPEIPFEVQTVPGQAEVHLVFIPATAITDKIEFRLRSTLQPSAGDTISAPRLEVLDSAQVEHFLSLPKQSGAQAIVWETRGLDAPVDSESDTKYRVGSRMQAIVREVEQSRDEARVNLLDLQVAWRDDDRYVGLATYDLQPGVMPTCELDLPPGVDLWHCTIDGVAALVEQTDALAWRVWLGPEQLPQRLEVIFAGTAQRIVTPQASRLIAAPTLRGWDVGTTLWTLWPADGALHNEPMLSHTRATAGKQQAIRLRSIEQILAYDQGTVPRHRADDLDVWRNDWLQRLKVVRDRTDELNLSAAEASSNGRSENHSSVASSSAPDLARHWDQTMQRDSGPLRCALNGSAPTLTFIDDDAFLSGLQARTPNLLALLVCGGLCLFLARWRGLRDWLVRWPQLAGVVIGLVWWLWLLPSAIGWLLVALSLISLLRPPWSIRIAHGLR